MLPNRGERVKKISFLMIFIGLILGCIANTNPAPDEEVVIIDKQPPSLAEEVSAVAKEDVPVIEYLLPSENSKVRTEPITHVMIHFISNAAVKPEDPYNVKDVYNIFVDYGFSAHYMIARNGDIYRLVDENRVAFHAGKGSLPGFPEYDNMMNEFSIGIELLAVGTRDEMLSMIPGETYDSLNPSDIGYTDAQYDSLNFLLNEIADRHSSVLKNRQHIIGHEEYATGRKADPGSLFDWSRISKGWD